MRFGFHISIAGGFSQVLGRANVRRCEAIQFFSRNPRGWKYDPLDEGDAERFRSALQSSGMFPVFLHLPYLPNIACPNSKFYRRSIDSIAADLERAEQLGTAYLIIHIGHRLESSESEAVDAVSGAINEALARVENSVVILMENTAGQGSEIGHTFEQMAKILRGIGEKERIGICLDTAHLLEAGYDLSNRNGIERTLENFDRTIGLTKLHLLHLNDSKTPLGSRKDRHWHIGQGYIGLEGFRTLINHPLLIHLPGIMETPRTDTLEDLENMKTIRSLVAPSPLPSPQETVS